MGRQNYTRSVAESTKIDSSKRTRKGHSKIFKIL